MSSSPPIQDEIMRKLGETSPSALKQTLELEVSAMAAAPVADPRHDPIIDDLMKIKKRTLPLMAEDQDQAMAGQGHGDDETANDGEKAAESTTSTPPPLSIKQLSLRLRKLLKYVLDPVLPDESRIHYENMLKKLLVKPPRVKPGEKKYPNDYLSRILMDNYALFLKAATLYFNLSFASLVTRYIVSIIYSLECWEIYHLLQVIPNIEYMLTLLDFDIKLTSFGHVVRPPANYLNFNLRQGLQYPFPFPFYNFSYHPVDPRAAARKMHRVSIKPYIDLRLDKLPPKPRHLRVFSRPLKPAAPEFPYVSDSDQSSADSEDFRRWKIVYMFVEMTPDRIQHDFDLCFVTPEQRIYEDEEYDTDRAMLMDLREQDEAMDTGTPGLRMVSSVFQKAFSKAVDNGLIQNTFLHQCKLMDPTSHKTCLKVFYGKNELHRHQEFVHATKKRLYRCAYCLKDDNDESKKSYPRYDSLARHMRRKHGIVGRENKQAVLLARKVAETEEIFSTRDDQMGSGQDEHEEARATLTSTTGISRVVPRTGAGEYPGLTAPFPSAYSLSKYSGYDGYEDYEEPRKRQRTGQESLSLHYKFAAKDQKQARKALGMAQTSIQSQHPKAPSPPRANDAETLIGESANFFEYEALRERLQKKDEALQATSTTATAISDTTPGTTSENPKKASHVTSSTPGNGPQKQYTFVGTGLLGPYLLQVARPPAQASGLNSPQSAEKPVPDKTEERANQSLQNQWPDS